MKKILIIEDDDYLAHEIADHVNSWGYETRCIDDFRNVLPAFADFTAQLVLIDISLPFFNGYHWCTEIRKISKVPIIFISSASDGMNVLTALNAGADDFIAKPFDLTILTAKIQALFRRAYEFGNNAFFIEHKGVILDTANAVLLYQGKKIELTKNENKILQILLENRGTVVARDAIMTCLWETDCYIDDNTLTVNILRLRKKLEEASLKDLIVTKKGAGYMVE